MGNVVKEKGMKMVFVLLLLMIMVLAACSSNTDTNEQNTGESKTPTTEATTPVEPAEKAPEPVTLKALLLGPGKQQDSDKVWAEFNKQLQAYLPNTKVEFEIIPAAQYAERWKLIAASGEKVDIAWTGWMIPYVDEVKRGSYQALDELIDKHAPMIRKEMPNWVLSNGIVDGKLYSIPNYQISTDMRLTLRYPAKLSACFNKAEAQATFYKYGPASMESLNVIEAFLQCAKDRELLQKGISPTMLEFLINRHDGLLNPYMLDNAFKVGMATGNYSNTKVINHYETKEMKLVYDKMVDWFKKGLVRQDILSLQNPRQDEGKEDGYILWVHGLTGTEADLAASESKSKGFPIDVIAMEEFYKISNLQSATSATIPRTAQNPDRAMQLLELLHTGKGKDLYNLLVFGLEGEHYKKVSNDRIETIGYSGFGTADSKYGLWKWAVGNTFNANETQTDIEGYNKLVESVHEKAIVSSLIGFKPNTDNVQTELAQIRAVAKEFHNSLITGAVANHEKVYTEFMDKLEKAGSKKVEAELQKQVDAFLAKK